MAVAGEQAVPNLRCVFLESVKVAKLCVALVKLLNLKAFAVLDQAPVAQRIAGNESAKEFGKLLAAADQQSPLRLRLGGPEYPGDSDHEPFSAAGVPILYMCTGSHEDRHTPADTADKINFSGMARIVDFCEDVLDRLLLISRPTFVPRPKIEEVRKLADEYIETMRKAAEELAQVGLDPTRGFASPT